MKSKMRQTLEAGTEFWNDSCSLRELSEAVAEGAVGATSNPVIVNTVVRQEPEVWLQPLDAIIRDRPHDTEAEIAWNLISYVGARAAGLLRPAFERSGGLQGRLSLQVNPQYYRSPEKMLDHARTLSALAPNLAIKLPCIAPGLAAIEEATAEGICVNVTVSFSVGQAVAAAKAIHRGLARYEKDGKRRAAFRPYVTIMVGRLDDHLKRVTAARRLAVDSSPLEWAGIAVFKKAYTIFQARGYRPKLLVAAYRNQHHWAEFIGADAVLSMPYEWWKRYNDSDVEVRRRIDTPVDPSIIDCLVRTYPDFVAAYDEEGLQPDEFIRFGPTVHTLNQFLGGYQNLLEYVRGRMLQ